MTYNHGAQTIETYEGKRIIKSGAVGATNAEEVKWLIDGLTKLSVPFKNDGWGYICDIGKMAPVTPDVSEILVGLHKRLAECNCKAMAFVNFAAFITGAQAKEHSKKSHTGIVEATFRTEEEAIKWIESVI